MARLYISDEQRRRRLGRRHAIAPAHRVLDPVAAARSVVALHATEPASVHLAVAARVDGVGVADVDGALYDERSLVKQLAMRRTLFAFPRERLPSALSSAADRVARALVVRITGAVARNGIATDPDGWLEAACCAVEGAVREAGALSNAEIRERVPMVRGTVAVGTGRWGQDVQLSPWVCTLLSLRGRLLRGLPTGSWTGPRPRWHATDLWLGSPVEMVEPQAAFAELVRLWLERFGPGTLDDVVWWLGATKGIVRTALADLSAVEVELDGPSPGYVLPGDVEEEPDIGPWAALLPVLDATTMGWKGRSFYLDPDDVAYLFDANGNAGTTAWWDGRIVGCWVQGPEGAVRVVSRHPLPKAAVAALDVEADRLTAWLAGTHVRTTYSSRQMKGEPVG
jgi:hypothetical protein